MSNTVICVEDLGKKYVIGHQQQNYTSLRDALADKIRSVSQFFSHQSPPEDPIHEEFWALKDVSFEIKQGDRIGIIGRNGAGKSTLLKILSRITEPTEGKISINGRIASLLEVGTGFHPELTGRENIFLNGAILGMRKAEINQKFDEIVAFSEIEKFLDTPVKWYSSGMYVRLAFAVAAHLDPEILIVDEVLAVGDAAFQKKCLSKIEALSAQEGRTVIFVSHNLGTIRKLCSTAIVLEKGNLVFTGACYESTQKYLTLSDDYFSNNNTLANTSINFQGRKSSPNKLIIIDAWLELDNNKSNIFLYGQNSVILVILVQPIETKEFGVEIVLRDNKKHPIAFSPSGLSQGMEFKISTLNQVTIKCHFPQLCFAQGLYYLDINLVESGVQSFDHIESALSFKIEGTSIGPRHWSFTQSTEQGCIFWDVKYTTN